jgi:lambda family phage tail tape measure protein
MLKGNFSDIASSFTDMLLKMAANAASINLGNAIFGGNFDKTGQIGGLLGGMIESIWPTSSVGNLTGSSLSGATYGTNITFGSGGFTGAGDKYDEAGIVHKGEFVFNKESTDRIGVSNLYRMMRGYASGGLVGGGAAPAGGVAVNITNNSSQPVGASQPKISFDSMGRMVIDVMLNDLQKNGPYARQLKGVM